MDIGRIELRNPVAPGEFGQRFACSLALIAWHGPPFDMHPRFFSDEPLSQPIVRLSGDEAHHLAHVRRVQPGERVILWDGSGVEAEAEVLEVGRHEVTLRMGDRRAVNRESPVKLTIAVALPKGDRQHFLIEKCVELGVHSIVPLETAFGVARPNAAALARCRRYVIEASKQCGRNQRMHIADPEAVTEFLCHEQAHAARWLADPSCGGDARRLAIPGSAAVVAAIGPEGGWDAREREAALAHGWQPISLGPRILRTETAALAVAAWCGLKGGG